jgi:hypothetical protein
MNGHFVRCGICPKFWAVIVTVAAMGACQKNSAPPASIDSSEGFRLTEESAIRQLLATQYVAGLKAAIPGRRLVCQSDGVTKDGMDVHLGDRGDDFVFRIGFYRVTTDGRVWMNQDGTGLEERWKIIE